MTNHRDLLPMLRAMWPDILDPNRLFVLSRVPDEAAYCRLHAWHLSELAAAEENGRLSAAFSSKPNPAIDALWHAAEAAALERAAKISAEWLGADCGLALLLRKMSTSTARTLLAERDERMRREGLVMAAKHVLASASTRSSRNLVKEILGLLMPAQDHE